MQAWNKHMSGLEELVSMRGPQLPHFPFGQEMFEDICSLMVKATVIPVLIDQY